MGFSFKGSKNAMQARFGFRESPYSSSAIFNPDEPGLYFREFYGDQIDEAHQKFFLRPMQRADKGMIGALWSSHAGDDSGRGFGKSAMMYNEAERIDQDFGASLLRDYGVSEEDIANHPFLAGYASFNKQAGLLSFQSVALEAMRNLLTSRTAQGETVHAALRQRILERSDFESDDETGLISELLFDAIEAYRHLVPNINVNRLHQFISALVGPDTDALDKYLRGIGPCSLGPRSKTTDGFTLMHVFHVFAELAGIVYIVYFIDQIETFAIHAKRRRDSEIKVLREALRQTAPTSRMASFIMQMHMIAHRELEYIWRDSEDLPSLDFQKKANAPRIVDLKGLQTTRQALDLVQRLHERVRLADFTAEDALHPFNEEQVEAVRDAVGGNPRNFIKTMDAILSRADTDDEDVTDEIVKAVLADQDSDFGNSDDEDDVEFASVSNPERM